MNCGVSNLNVYYFIGDSFIFTVSKYMLVTRKQRLFLHCKEPTVGNMGGKSIHFKNKN